MYWGQYNDYQDYPYFPYGGYVDEPLMVSKAKRRVSADLLPGTRLQVLSDGLNLRCAPSVEARRITAFSEGHILTAHGPMAGPWAKVTGSVDGYPFTGWVNTNFTRIVSGGFR